MLLDIIKIQNTRTRVKELVRYISDFNFNVLVSVTVKLFPETEYFPLYFRPRRRKDTHPTIEDS